MGAWQFALCAALLGTCLVRAPGVRADETVIACVPPYFGGGVMQGVATFGIGYADNCAENVGGTLNLRQDGVNHEQYGQTASWTANVPAGLGIVGASIGNVNVSGVLGTGYIAEFVWDGGAASERFTDSVPYSFAGLWTGDFGWQLECLPSQGGPCAPGNDSGGNPTYLDIGDVQFDVRDSPGYLPGLAPSGPLWSQSGWVRGGGWSVGFTSGAVPGICQESASLNGIALPGAVSIAPNQSGWVQCQAPAYSVSGVDTTQFGQGAMSLALSATDAAAVSNGLTKTVYVDNAVPTVALSGPTNASSTAGTQHVTATSTVGPSGLRSINCSVDGGPNQSFASSPAEIPVSGDGNHTISCTATNQAYDVNGQPATSAPATWQIDIGQPTVSGIAFTKLVDGLRCRKVKERVKVSARSAGHRRGRTETKKIVKCHARTARRRVTVLVKVRRHGKVVLVKRRKIERVVVAPHVSSKSVERVRFGKAAIIDGWLGTSAGVALAGRSVVVMTAPENGLGQWSQAANVTTAANGSWAVQLPSGPSRLVQAAYSGDPTTLPSTSATVRLTVPAKLKLHVFPHRTRWGRTIRISGRVLGGYIPAGKLLRLRIGVEGVRGTVGIPSIGRDGRFHTTWTFSAGHGVVRYWFSVSTLNEADYPFAPASSKRVYVTVR